MNNNDKKRTQLARVTLVLPWYIKTIIKTLTAKQYSSQLVSLEQQNNNSEREFPNITIYSNNKTIHVQN